MNEKIRFVILLTLLFLSVALLLIANSNVSQSILMH